MKLFPRPWIRLGQFGHRDAVAAAALEKNWQKWLELAIGRVNPRALEADGFDAVDALRALSGRKLLVLDEALRREAVREQVSTESADAPPPDAYLFVACCNPSGYVRERAVIAFKQYPCPLALATGLIRSTDWVPQVRRVAVSLIESLVPQLEPGDLVRFLDLIVGLKGRVRVPGDLWRSVLERKLRAPESRDALWLAAGDPRNSTDLRRAAFGFLSLGDPAEVPRVLERALADTDPVIGMWALGRIASSPAGDELAGLLRNAIRARHAAVRRTALRQVIAAKPEDAAATLREALFDPSHGVRAVAAFELEHSHGEGPLPLLRAALHGPERRKASVALLALCELGDTQDVEAIAARSVQPRSAIVRAAVLKGLARVKSSKLDAVVAAALFDRSTIVLRQLAEIYRRGSASLDIAVLDSALAQASEALMPRLFVLLDTVGKWDALEFLLRNALSDDYLRAAHAADQVDRWILGEGRRFTAPSPGQAQRLMELARVARSRHSERKWGRIDSALSVFVLR